MNLKNRDIKEIEYEDTNILIILFGSKVVQEFFQIDNIQKFIDELNLREKVLLKVLIRYKLARPRVVLKIKLPEYKSYLRKKELNIPIDIAIALAKSNILIPMADEDYIATWDLLNKIKDKCSFIIFPNIIEN